MSKTVDVLEATWTVLHFCAEYTWVEGVKFLMSREPKLTIKEKLGSNKVSQFVEPVPNLCSFEIKRFIGLGWRTTTPKMSLKCSNFLLKVGKM